MANKRCQDPPQRDNSIYKKRRKLIPLPDICPYNAYLKHKMILYDTSLMDFVTINGNKGRIFAVWLNTPKISFVNELIYKTCSIQIMVFDGCIDAFLNILTNI
jgi:hypothetical protein